MKYFVESKAAFTQAFFGAKSDILPPSLALATLGNSLQT
jgi:hypothetical protein